MVSVQLHIVEDCNLQFTVNNVRKITTVTVRWHNTCKNMNIMGHERGKVVATTKKYFKSGIYGEVCVDQCIKWNVHNKLGKQYSIIKLFH